MVVFEKKQNNRNFNIIDIQVGMECAGALSRFNKWRDINVKTTIDF